MMTASTLPAPSGSLRASASSTCAFPRMSCGFSRSSIRFAAIGSARKTSKSLMKKNRRGRLWDVSLSTCRIGSLFLGDDETAQRQHQSVAMDAFVIGENLNKCRQIIALPLFEREFRKSLELQRNCPMVAARCAPSSPPLRSSSPRGRVVGEAGGRAALSYG